LVIARFTFQAEERAVKLIGVLSQPFFASNCAALFRGDNFLVHVSDFVVKTFDVLFQRIIFWNRRSRFCHIASQKQNSVYQRAFNSNARLVLWRVADLGTDLGLSLSINGIPITTLFRGGGYVRDRYSLSVREGKVHPPSGYFQTRRNLRGHSDVGSGDDPPSRLRIWRIFVIHWLGGSLSEPISSTTV
jgi:hypothetical protein